MTGGQMSRMTSSSPASASPRADGVRMLTAIIRCHRFEAASQPLLTHQKCPLIRDDAHRVPTSSVMRR